MSDTRLRRLYSSGFISVFLLLLILPLRTLALDPYAIDEGFYGRNYLVQIIADLRVVLGDRVFPKVLVGDEGWLIYTAENDIEDYQRAQPFEESELARIQDALDELTARLQEQGTTLLVVIPPNKNTIYPERVPAAIRLVGDQSKLDQLLTYMRTHGDTQILDLRPALLAVKEERQAYYATDTHWNDYGAYAAYGAILDALAPTFPSLVPHPASDFEVVVRSPETLDLAENIGTGMLTESQIQFVPQFDLQTNYRILTVGGRRIQFSHNPNAFLPSAIIYHDSFFFRVNPLLGEHFRDGMFIQNYMGGGLWTLDWVDERRPDIVIIEFAERYLHDLPLLIDPDE